MNKLEIVLVIALNILLYIESTAFFSLALFLFVIPAMNDFPSNGNPFVTLIFIWLIIGIIYLAFSVFSSIKIYQKKYTQIFRNISIVLASLPLILFLARELLFLIGILKI